MVGQGARYSLIMPPLVKLLAGCSAQIFAQSPTSVFFVDGMKAHVISGKTQKTASDQRQLSLINIRLFSENRKPSLES
jgi:hypothetical protein